MKLRPTQIQINQINITFLRLMLAVSSIFFLFSLNLFAQSQIPPVEQQETPTTTNLAVTATPPNLNNRGKEGETNRDLLPEKKPLLITENLIHNGDVLDVDVLGTLEYDWRGKTDDDGFLSSLPYLEVSIFALCRTEDEIKGEITAAYSKIIRNPRVVVSVLDRSNRQPATLFGAVSVPQRFRIQRSVQLSELIVMSGGITDKASGEINVFRPAHVSCIGHNQNHAKSHFIKVKVPDSLAGKTDSNPQVRAGDVITVEEAAPVYVTGGIAAPQRVLFRTGMTLSRVVASAGGLAKNADRTRVTIYRRQKDSSNLEIVQANLEKILDQKAEDILLHAYDIIEIAQTGRALSLHPPVINTSESTQFDINKLPMRLVD